MKDYKDRVRLIIKQYPYKYRDFAFMSSEAALAANEQGKFWDWGDKMGTFASDSYKK